MRGKLTWLNLGKLLIINFPPLHHLIISTHVKHPPINFPKKVSFPHVTLFYEKSSPILCRGVGGGGGGGGEKRHYALSLNLCPFLEFNP